MSNVSHRTLGAAEDREYWVIAVLPEATLSDLRESLTDSGLRSVIVSNAVSLNAGGHEYAYRGNRFRSDKNVVRVDIACSERHVDRIVGALRLAITHGGSDPLSEGSVVAFPVSRAAEAVERAEGLPK
jgi:nitrogen regulatory protein PII